MDGNGRWAKKQELKRIEGHKEGVRVVKKITTHCVKLNVENLTLYTFSNENWFRPKTEVSSLMKLFVTTLNKEIKLLLDNNIRFKVIGDKLDETIKTCAQQINVPELKLQGYWSNINSYGDYNTLHNHKASIMSGVFYVDVPDENMGNINFERLDELNKIKGIDIISVGKLTHSANALDISLDF